MWQIDFTKIYDQSKNKQLKKSELEKKDSTKIYDQSAARWIDWLTCSQLHLFLCNYDVTLGGYFTLCGGMGG